MKLFDSWRLKDNYISESGYAVLMIDMERDFLKRLDSGEQDFIIANQIDYLNYCRESGIPVIEVNGLRKSDSRLREVISQFPSNQRNKFYKPDDSAFSNINVSSQLSYWGVNSVVLMGICASACVKSTAEEGLEGGFNILTSEQLMADPRNLPTYTAKVRYDKSLPWYKDNTIYRSNYTDLLSLIEKN
ncbi:isochorismatase family protein [Candidatus Woesearchaeota archaeon]|nr:isochorismatase family protein [Candidatus Woesearchaeota archaeon]